MQDDDVTDAQADAFLSSGREKPVLFLVMVRKVAWPLSLALFAVWVVVRDSRPGLGDVLWVLFWVSILSTFALRFLIPILDRRAFQKDMALIGVEADQELAKKFQESLRPTLSGEGKTVLVEFPGFSAHVVIGSETLPNKGPSFERRREWVTVRCYRDQAAVSGLLVASDPLGSCLPQTLDEDLLRRSFQEAREGSASEPRLYLVLHGGG